MRFVNSITKQVSFVNSKVDIDGINLLVSARGALSHEADDIQGLPDVCLFCLRTVLLPPYNSGFNSEFDLRLRRQECGGGVFLILPAIHLCLRRGILFEQAVWRASSVLAWTPRPVGPRLGPQPLQLHDCTELAE